MSITNVQNRIKLRFLLRYDYLIIGVIAFIYYFVLSAKNFTWFFASGDSGDWLASSIIWMNSQPYGSPLYVLLGHLLNLYVPQSELPVAMTVLLSVLPASITVSATYLIAKKITGNLKYAFVSVLVLLGAAIFLSQSTILEEYAIATMFVTLALYFYTTGRKKLTVLMLGLGTAIHIIVGLIAFIWFAAHIREWKQWWRTYWIFIVSGILPYALVLVLMYLPTPKFIAGYLSWESINSYLGSTGTIGSISWYEFLIRIPYFIGIMCVSVGLAIVPFIKAWQNRIGEPLRLMVLTIIFTIWLYVTDQDPSTWTFMTFSLPMIAIMAGYGLTFMSKKHYKIVAYGAVALIFVNSILLNANILSTNNPLATEFEKAEKALPDGSGIITCSGGSYGLGTMYVYAQGKDIFPLFLSGNNMASTDYKTDARYTAYVEWLNKEFELEGNNLFDQVQYLLDNGRPVYILIPTITPNWEGAFEYDKENKFIGKVTAVNY
jgi:hypothetical protein